MIPPNVPRYRNKHTGWVVRWLAAGSCNCKLGVDLVAIYCPDNNEHDIYVMPQKQFFKDYEPYENHHPDHS